MTMVELKGKMETTYAWTCDGCATECRVTDAPMICATCGKRRTEEKFLRHFKLIPTPIKVGVRFFP